MVAQFINLINYLFQHSVKLVYLLIIVACDMLPLCIIYTLCSNSMAKGIYLLHFRACFARVKLKMEKCRCVVHVHSLQGTLAMKNNSDTQYISRFKM